MVRSTRDGAGILRKITIPLLSAANWGGFGLHSRGNFEGYYRSPSKQKWLEVHSGNHRDAFYKTEGRALQKEFYDHFLKGKDNGWEKRAPVMLKIQHVDGTLKDRTENEWPIGRTVWTKLYLDPKKITMTQSPSSTVSKASYEALGNHIAFTSAPFEKRD